MQVLFTHIQIYHIFDQLNCGKRGDGKRTAAMVVTEPWEVLAKDISYDAKARFLDTVGIFDGGLFCYLSVQDLKLLCQMKVSLIQ